MFLFSGKVGPPAFFCVRSLYMLCKNQKSMWLCVDTRRGSLLTVFQIALDSVWISSQNPQITVFKDQFSVELEMESIHFVVVCF